jgi:glycopeptide antibiotics resistance protein
MFREMIKWFEEHSKISWIITIIIAIVIFYVSSLILPTGKATFPWKSLAYHFYAFLFLSIFLLISLTKGKNKNLILVSIIFTIIYAISDEIHQLFVPSRTFTVSDILTDSAGILFAVLLYSLLRYDKFKNNKEKKSNEERKVYS